MGFARRERVRVEFAQRRERFLLARVARRLAEQAELPARRRCRQRGGVLVLARPRGKPRDLIALTRVDELVPVLDELDAAVARAAR